MADMEQVEEQLKREGESEAMNTATNIMKDLHREYK
jgi:hypothetical protein